MDNLVKFTDDGKPILSNQGIIELAYQNKINNATFEWADTNTKQQYIKSSIFLDNYPFEFKEDLQNIGNWFTPDDYKNIDLDSFILTRCRDNQEIDRAKQELNIVHSLNAEPIFKHLIYIIDYWRSRNLVWGVGRGSSVSCFLLYVIGLHKINPIEYDLDYREFFKI